MLGFAVFRGEAYIRDEYLCPGCGYRKKVMKEEEAVAEI